jgi:hypothetical protein
MARAEEFRERLNEAARNYQFPAWECSESNATVALMRASGFRSGDNVAQVFERVEHSLDEGILQSMAYCFATFETENWVTPGRTISVNVRPSSGARLSFGPLEVTSRDRTFTIRLDREELISAGYLPKKARKPTADALLLALCDAIPRDYLFNTPGDLVEMFGMPADMQRLFAIDRWHHPSMDELYGEEPGRPGDMPDIAAMAEALCADDPQPKLSEEPNTSWREQCAGV